MSDDRLTENCLSLADGSVDADEIKTGWAAETFLLDDPEGERTADVVEL